MAAQNHPPFTAATTTTATATSSSRATTSSSSSLPPRPTIEVPERSLEGLFKGGMSPGPMTLVASFFNDQESENEYRSFSQLLAGAMASPKAAAFGSTGGPGFKPGSFALGPPSPLLTIPPGLSQTFLLDSPGFWSPGPFTISHQQALAHVTAQAVQAQSQMHPPVPPVQNYPSSQPPVQNYPPSQLSASVAPAQNSLVPLVNPVPLQQWPPRIPEPEIKAFESGGVSSSDKRPQQNLIPIDKPADDGYNWRKYGQKAVKGSECPRSYYKCTNPGCPVKKKVERSVEGHVTEIIYKGQHNHEPPPVSKRGKDGGSVEVNETAGWPVKSESGSQIYSQALDGQSMGKDSDAMDEQSSGSSDGAEVNEDACGKGEEIIDDEPEAKRRSIDSSNAPTASTHRTITEPRIVVQTTSEVDLLDDGYRWRKYGQKVVKGNPHPRSYYKCTNAGCNVRKHVERASTDAKAVITTYEGKHNHDVPATRHSSHHTANPSGNSGEITIAKQQPILTKPATLKMLSFAGNQQQQTSYQHQGSSMLRPKEER